MSITLSKKHGLNTSILKCPCCGTSTGLAMNGRLKGDAKAPREVIELKPCSTCIAKAGDDKVWILGVNQYKQEFVGCALVDRTSINIEIKGCVCLMHSDDFLKTFKE